MTQTTDKESASLLDRTVRAVRNLGWNTSVLAFRDETTQLASPVAISTGELNWRLVFLNAAPVPTRPNAWRQECLRINGSFFVDHQLNRLLMLLDPGWACQIAD